MALKGQGKHSRRLKAMTGPRMRGRIYTALFAGADLIRTEAALSIVAGSIQGKGHIPSKPGEPPNRDTAQLDTSIITEGDRSRLRAEVSANTDYAVDQELGNSKMAERPYMRPATDKNRDAVVRKVGHAVSITVRSGK